MRDQSDVGLRIDWESLLDRRERGAKQGVKIGFSAGDSVAFPSLFEQSALEIFNEHPPQNQPLSAFFTIDLVDRHAPS